MPTTVMPDCFRTKIVAERQSATKKRTGREKGVNNGEISEKNDVTVKKSETRDDVSFHEAS